MWTDWKIDLAMVDSMGDPLHNIMHTMGTDSVMGWNTVCYTRSMAMDGDVVGEVPLAAQTPHSSSSDPGQTIPA